MNLSSAGLDILKSLEAKRLVPYNDKATKSDPNPSSGNATVGYGHLLHKGPLDGTESPITDDTADHLLAEDVREDAEVFVNRVVAPLNQNQYDALCIFCFNVGSANFNRVASETGLMNGNPDYALVPQKILLYNKSRNSEGQLAVLPGLTKRRKIEAELFQKPLILE